MYKFPNNTTNSDNDGGMIWSKFVPLTAGQSSEAITIDQLTKTITWINVTKDASLTGFENIFGRIVVFEFFILTKITHSLAGKAIEAPCNAIAKLRKEHKYNARYIQ